LKGQRQRDRNLQEVLWDEIDEMGFPEHDWNQDPDGIFFHISRRNSMFYLSN
jgi:hypothetical protein